MVISHNLMAQNANRQFNIVGKKKAKNTEKLSSGYRINRSADDAAGLAISEKMRWQIRGLDRAAKNIEDGISFVQTGEGALGEVHEMLHRMKELAVQAANDTNTSTDRAAIDLEVQQIKSEIKSIFNDTSFNTKYIFRMPFVPDVEGRPTDMDNFNSVLSGVGGAEINHVRYTWKEMGFSISGDGLTFAEECSFETTLDNGEKLTLVGHRGDSVNNLARQYTWSADTTGIKVNNLAAVSWNELLSSTQGQVRPDTDYSFTYNGTTITFNTDEASTLEEMMGGINGDGGMSMVSWESTLSSRIPETAVTFNSTSTINITQNNHSEMYNGLHLKADEKGIGIKEYNYAEHHTFTTWDKLFGEADGTTDGWGQTSSSNKTTFNENDVYTYTDEGAAKGIKVNLVIQDESSKEAVINGINNAEFGISTSTPVKLNFENTDGALNILSFSTDFFNTLRQQMCFNRNFDDANDDISNLRYSVHKQVNWDNPIKVYAKNGDEYVEKNIYRSKLDVAFTIYGHNNNIYESMDNDTLQANHTGPDYIFWTRLQDMYIGDESMEYDDNGNMIYYTDGQGNGRTVVQSQKSSYTFDLESTYHNAGNTTARIALDASKLTQADWMDKDITFIKTGTGSLKANGIGTATLNVKNNNIGNTNYQNYYGVKVNPPEKLIHIQSGALGMQDIPIRYSALNLSVIGIGATGTKDHGSCQAAISEVDNATDYISSVRGLFGAYHNRLEHAYDIDQNTSENAQAAESRIRDTDMAKESVEYAKHSILEQAGQSVISQANQTTEGVLRLLQ